TGHSLGRSKECLGGRQIAVLAQHDVDQGTVAIDCTIEIPPSAPHSDVRLIDVPAAPDPALAFAAQVLDQSRGELGFPLPHCLVGKDEAAGQEHLRQVPQAQLVPQGPENHEGYDIARVLCFVHYVCTALVELFAAWAAE